MHRTSPKLNALVVYVILEFSAALLFSLVFTVETVYHITVVKLNPLQLVLVGTILEGTIFLCEIPTGALADVKSRRLSIIIGYVLIGLGFVVEGSLPHFATVAFAQVLWGLGYTFTSGATQAWIVDEIGSERAGEAFLRAAQSAKVGGLVAIPLSVWLGRTRPGLPVVVGGICMVLLAVFLILVMPEQGFKPALIPQEGVRSTYQDRHTVTQMLETVKDTRRLTRRQPVLLALLGIGFFYGLYSEGLDRLWTVHLMQDFVMPGIGVLQPVLWFGAIRAVHLVISLFAVEVARRASLRRSFSVPGVLAGSAALIVLALCAFGLTTAFWVALVLYWAIQVLRSVSAPLQDAWLNERIDDPHVRATVFSVSSQVDAVGQISGGPLVGVIGNALSIRAALVTSGLMLSPVLPLYALARRLLVPRTPPTAAVEQPPTTT
jgi:DHA3 family tetracycline resistance protein-like MFS transporter